MAALSNNINDPNLTTALGAAPVAADEVNINQFSTLFSGGTTALGVDLLKLLLGPAFQGSFATPLTFKCNQAGTGVVEIRGASRDFTIGSVATADVHNEVIVKMARDYLLTYTQSTLNKLRLLRGRMLLDATCIATDVLQTTGDLTLDGAVGPPTTATLLAKGGSVMNNRIVTTGTVDGDCKLTMDNAAGSFGTLNWAGSTFSWLRGNISTKLNAYKGIIDMSGLKVAVTIADYLIGEDVKVILPPKNIMANPFTNAAKFIGAGPTILQAS